jgi:threonyl-tRNA synthetase
LARIEAEMKNIAAEGFPLIREELSKQEAIELFSRMNQPYKLELLEELPEEVSVYRQGEFVDLCQGPHVGSTAEVKHFKLQSVAGAYWRGDSSRPMLQRIHLRLLEEAAKRDHRKLGKELDLFSIQDEGPGFPFFHPKGMVIRNTLEDFWRAEHVKRGYQEVKTPIMLHEDLWHRSGHWDNYRENMYFSEIDEQRFAIKPMNCPGGMLLYKRKLHSYRDLPLRVGELGLVHRHELSGALHGLMRVRCFTQDDAHIFMLPSQIQAEIEGVIDFIHAVYTDVFGFPYHVELSTKPENAIGDDLMWEKATQALKDALEAKGLPYVINEGDGAFYGPKIDFHLEDSIGRTWQCGTIQLDFAMPERFDLTYIDEDGQRRRPVMLHRVIFGSIERFIGILTEHYAGAFPAWLAPVQVMVIPVSDGQSEYARELERALLQKGLRAESDLRSESVGKKIRAAQLQKVPYMVIVGEREQQEGTISVRHRKRGDLGSTSLETFSSELQKEIADRR